MKKKRERLCSVLIQKLVVKYGVANEALIAALVDQFVEEKAQIAPEDLARLEKEVVLSLKTRVNVSKSNKDGNSSSFAANQGLGGGDGSGAGANANAKKFGSDNSNPASAIDASSSSDGSLVPPPPGAEWKVIAAYQELQAEAKNEDEKRIARQKKLDFKAALDKHIADTKNFQAKNVQSADDAYQRRMLADVEKFHEEERLKRERLHAKGQEQLRIQKQQIADAKLRHEKEMVELRKVEVQLLAKAADEIQAEADKQARIRRYAKEQQAIVDKDNEANEKLRQLQAIKDAEEDQRLMAEYAAKIDRDDYARANAHAERMKKMEAFNLKFENDGAGKALKEERIRVEQLLLKEQAEAEAAAIAKEQKKAHDKKVRLQTMLHENEKLVDAKLAAKERQRKLDEEFAQKAMADVNRFHEENASLKEKNHAKHMQYREVLDYQKANKPAQADPTSAAFIGRESLVNRSLYEKAVHDPKVLQKLNSPPKPVQKGPRMATHK
jgi:hypothetical protein